MAERMRQSTTMDRRRRLIGLVVAINVVAGLSFWTLHHLHGVEGWFYVSLLGMLPSHGSLLATWAVLGGKANPWRLVAAVVGVVVWMRALEKFCPGDYPLIWAPTLFMTMCLLSVLLMVIRFLGAELTVASGADAAGGLKPKQQWFQFSLRSLLSWTTALALLFGSFNYLPKKLLLLVLSFPDATIFLGAIIPGSALIACGAIWITLGTRWPPARYIVLILAGVAALLLLYLVLS